MTQISSILTVFSRFHPQPEGSLLPRCRVSPSKSFLRWILSNFILRNMRVNVRKGDKTLLSSVLFPRPFVQYAFLPIGLSMHDPRTLASLFPVIFGHFFFAKSYFPSRRNPLAYLGQGYNPTPVSIMIFSCIPGLF